MKLSRKVQAVLAGSGILIAGLLFYFLAYAQRVEVFVDGEAPLAVITRAHRVGDVLVQAGLDLRPGDQLNPPAEAWFLNPPEIRFNRAVPIQIWDGEKITTLLTHERQPAKVLSQININLKSGDTLWMDGAPRALDQPAPAGAGRLFQIRRAVTIHLDEGKGVKKEIASSAATLGEALWEAGIRIKPADRLSTPVETQLTQDLDVRLERANPLTFQLKGGTVQVSSAASTVGEALSEAGLSLQGLDYSVPAEDQPVPEDGQIRVVRVSEEIRTTQKLLPFKKEYKNDPQTELDHESVVQAGQMGIVMTRERVRYEDGEETGKVQEAEWTAQDPVAAVIGRGTKVVVHTEEVNGETISYWRKVTVYATSYSPCQSGVDKCMNGTASGMPLRQGVVAVSWNWYRDMVGQQIYVPGYGKAVIGDNGGGIPGRYWIDLGYTDEQYQAWHQWVTIYFLTPVPKIIPYILYP